MPCKELEDLIVAFARENNYRRLDVVLNEFDGAWSGARYEAHADGKDYAYTWGLWVTRGPNVVSIHDINDAYVTWKAWALAEAAWAMNALGAKPTGRD